MNQFTTKYSYCIDGTLSGFDRLVLRGTLLRLCFAEGMCGYLDHVSVLLKNFGTHVDDVSKRIREASLAPVIAEGRPIDYLSSAALSKEAIARQIAEREQITDGTVCVLRAVEPCHSYDIYRNQNTKHLDLVYRYRKCMHLYHYIQHPVFGFMNARIQTWFPFTIQICLNGREWLARQMNKAGIAYKRADNCFVWIKDYKAAQNLMNEQLNTDWLALLNPIASRLNPLHEELFGSYCPNYNWTSFQSEWATDMVFSDPTKLRSFYPRLVQQAMTTLGSADVMRFLGKPVPVSGNVRAGFSGEVCTDIKSRTEGVRIKHRLEKNSVKMYDKAVTSEAAVLRVETTIHDAKAFRVMRPKAGGSEHELSLRILRKNIADLGQRAEVSDKCNERYLTALANMDTDHTLKDLLPSITKPTSYRNKRVRALRPLEQQDMWLLAAISRGEFTINGLRNRDIKTLYFGNDKALPAEERRRCAFIGRKIRLLRAHGILQKRERTHLYEATEIGYKIISALLTVQDVPVNRLISNAA